jgi:hypothetical protein
MKKYLLLLLFIPLMSIGQSYKDVMSINSLDTFKKVAIENGYEFDENDGEWVSYGYNIVKDSINGNKSIKWMWYNLKDHRFTLRLSRTSTGLFGAKSIVDDSVYDLIVSDIKEKCKYYKIINYKDEDYVSYSCSDSSYKGKIGFMISEGDGYVRHFPPNAPTE